MRIIDARELTVPLEARVANSLVDFSKMTVSMVAVVSDIKRRGRPIVGYGFNSIGRYAQGGLLRERFLPRLLTTDPEALVDDAGLPDPTCVVASLMRNEKPGGHGERSAAVAAVELAVWDLLAKLEEKPLYQVLAERFGDGKADHTVSVYAAGGYYASGGAAERRESLQRELRGYLDLGYRTVKIKIGGEPLDDDLRRVEAALEVVPDPRRLAVDANGRLEHSAAIQYVDALAPIGLRWMEEMCDPLDYALQAQLCAHTERPFATGENLFSVQDVRNLVRYAGLRPDRDLLQMDPGLSYGLVEFVRMLDAIEERGWSRRSVLPHGGHLMGLHAAAGLRLGGCESYPGVFSPFSGFGPVAIEGGAVTIPDTPGIGLETKPELAPTLQALTA